MTVEGMTTKPASVVRSEPHRQLDAWIKEATQGLCDPAVELVRQQIMDKGTPVEELGDPSKEAIALRAIHLTKREYFYIYDLVAPLPRLIGTFDWRSVLIVTAPALLGILLFTGIWSLNDSDSFPGIVMLVFLAPLFLFGLVAAAITFLAYSRKLHFNSTAGQIRARACIRGFFIFECVICLALTSTNIVDIILDLLLVAFIASECWELFHLLNAVSKVRQLEAMGVPYVKPYWERLEGERAAA